jgi:hypothetical protein
MVEQGPSIKLCRDVTLIPTNEGMTFYKRKLKRKSYDKIVDMDSLIEFLILGELLSVPPDYNEETSGEWGPWYIKKIGNFGQLEDYFNTEAQEKCDQDFIDKIKNDFSSIIMAMIKKKLLWSSASKIIEHNIVIS